MSVCPLPVVLVRANIYWSKSSHIPYYRHIPRSGLCVLVIYYRHISYSELKVFITHSLHISCLDLTVFVKRQTIFVTSFVQISIIELGRLCLEFISYEWLKLYYFSSVNQNAYCRTQRLFPSSFQFYLVQRIICH